MPDPQPDKPEERRSFWTTLPGLLTGLAALITAIAGVIAIFVVPGSSSDGPTHADWARSANRLCNETAEQVRHLPPITDETLEAIETTAPAAAADVRRLAERLRELSAPEDDEPSIDRFTSVLEEEANQLDAMVAAYHQANSSGMVQAAEQVEALAAEGREVAGSLGVSACTQEVTLIGY